MNKLTISALFLVFGVGSAFGQTTLFDATNAPTSYFPPTPPGNTNETGEYFGLIPNAATVTGISSMIFYIPTAETYSDLQLSVTFFGSGQTSYTGVGNEFSDPLLTNVFDFGAQTKISGEGNQALTLSSPVAVTGDAIGAQFTWINVVAGRATPAAGIYNVFSLSNTVGPATGFNALTGGGMDLFELGGNSDSSTPLAQSTGVYNAGDVHENLSVTLSGTTATPEPSSFAFLGLGVVGLLVGRRRSRKS